MDPIIRIGFRAFGLAAGLLALSALCVSCEAPVDGAAGPYAGADATGSGADSAMSGSDSGAASPDQDSFAGSEGGENGAGGASDSNGGGQTDASSPDPDQYDMASSPNDAWHPQADTASGHADTGAGMGDSGEQDSGPVGFQTLYGRLLLAEVESLSTYQTGSVALAHFGLTQVDPSLTGPPTGECETVYALNALNVDKLGSTDADELFGDSPALVPWVGPDWPVTDSVNLGAIQFTGTLVPIVLRYEADDVSTYEASYDWNSDWIFASAGTALHAYSAGGPGTSGFESDAFTPTPVTLIEPALGPTVSINLDVPLVVRWEMATLGTEQMEVRVAGVGKDGEALGAAVVRCSLSGDPGQVSIPPELLDSVPRSFGTNLAVSVTRVRQTQVDLSGKAVIFRAQHSVIGTAKAK